MSVAEHPTTLHQVDSKNVGEAKAVVILEPNPKEIAVSGKTLAAGSIGGATTATVGHP